MDLARFTRIDPTTWQIEPHGAMRVPAVIYADENLIRDMDDKVFEQAANVATLPGIVQASYAMPDGVCTGTTSAAVRPVSIVRTPHEISNPTPPADTIPP
jgi:hypothetical protein